MKKALITGITGQDGSYLADYLLSQGYEIHGVVRRVAFEDAEHRFERIRHILDKVILHPGSIESFASLFHILSNTQFDEIYHLAAQSFVAESFEDSFGTMNTNINGTHYLLAALKQLQPKCKFYFAATSEMFGKVRESPQRETTPFHPRSPYGISKVAGYELVRNYREAYDLFAVSGILFNHESPRRGREFVTRKISSAVARIYHGLQSELQLGNLEASRDWGHAKDYVRAMHLILQSNEPTDFVVSTGEMHTVREFCEIAFGEVGLNYQNYVKLNPRFVRPAEVDVLQGDSSNARAKLGWKPTYSFQELVKEMVTADLEYYSPKRKDPSKRDDKSAA